MNARNQYTTSSTPATIDAVDLSDQPSTSRDFFGYEPEMGIHHHSYDPIGLNEEDNWTDALSNADNMEPPGLLQRAKNFLNDPIGLKDTAARVSATVTDNTARIGNKIDSTTDEMKVLMQQFKNQIDSVVNSTDKFAQITKPIDNLANVLDNLSKRFLGNGPATANAQSAKDQAYYAIKSLILACDELVNESPRASLLGKAARVLKIRSLLGPFLATMDLDTYLQTVLGTRSGWEKETTAREAVSHAIIALALVLVDSIKGEESSDELVAQGATTAVTALLAALATADPTGFLYSPDRQMMERLKGLSAVCGAFRGAQFTIGTAVTCIYEAIKFIHDMLSGEFRERRQLEADFKLWSEASVKITTDIDQFTQIRKDPAVARWFAAHYKTGESLAARFTAYGKNSEKTKLINFTLSRWKDLLDEARSALLAAQERDEPTVVLIEGKTKIGKSHIVEALSHALLTHVGDLQHREKFVPHQNIYRYLGGEFFDNYRQQGVFWVDDFAQVREQERYTRFLEFFFQACGDQPLSVNMAALMRKETTYFTSKFMLMTSNGPNADINNVILDKTAFQRRFNFTIEMFLKPDFEHANGGIDAEKAAGVELDDVYEFAIKTFNIKKRRNCPMTYDGQDRVNFTTLAKIIAGWHLHTRSRHTAARAQERAFAFEHQFVELTPESAEEILKGLGVPKAPEVEDRTHISPDPESGSFKGLTFTNSSCSKIPRYNPALLKFQGLTSAFGDIAGPYSAAVGQSLHHGHDIDVDTEDYTRVVEQFPVMFVHEEGFGLWVIPPHKQQAWSIIIVKHGVRTAVRKEAPGNIHHLTASVLKRHEKKPSSLEDRLAARMEAPTPAPCWKAMRLRSRVEELSIMRWAEYHNEDDVLQCPVDDPYLCMSYWLDDGDYPLETFCRLAHHVRNGKTLFNTPCKDLVELYLRHAPTWTRGPTAMAIRLAGTAVKWIDGVLDAMKKVLPIIAGVAAGLGAPIALALFLTWLFPPEDMTQQAAMGSGDQKTQTLVKRGNVSVPTRGMHSQAKELPAYVQDEDGTLTSPAADPNKWNPGPAARGAECVLNSVAASNVVELKFSYYKNGSVLSHMNIFGLGLKGKTIITALHPLRYMSDVCGKDVVYDPFPFMNGVDCYAMRIFYKRQGQGNFCEIEQWKCYTPGPESDLCFLSCPTLNTFFGDITGHFNSMDSFQRVNFHQYGLIHARGMVSMSNTNPFKISLEPVSSPNVRNHQTVGFGLSQGKEIKTLIDISIVCTGKSAAGMCGTPYATMDPRCAKKIIGIHIAGSNTQVCLVPVYSEDIENYFAAAGPELAAQSVVLESQTIEESSSLWPLEGANINVVGQLSPTIAPIVRVKTNIGPSLIQVEGSTITAPAELQGRMVDGRYMAMEIPNIKKQEGHQLPLWLHSDVKKVQNALIQEQRARISAHINRVGACKLSSKLVNDDDNLNGFKCVNKVETSTSPGIPWTSLAPKLGKHWTAPGKKGIIFRNPTTDRLELNPEYKIVVEKMDKSANNSIPATVCQIFLKDERRPKHKTKAPRTISTLPYEHTHIMRRYFGEYMNFLLSDHDNSEIAIGTNGLGADWDRMHDYLSQVGENKIAYDFEAYDKRLPFQLIEASIPVIEDYYKTVAILTGEEYDPQHAVARRNLLLGVGHAFYIVQQTVFHTPYGNPSGQALTTQLNCLVNQFLIRLAFMAIMGPDYRYEDHVRCKVYGDDFAAKVSDAVASKFNFRTIKKYFADNHIKITWPNKYCADKEEDFCDDKDFTFLKRSFARDPKTGFICGPLDWETIMEMPQWIRKVMDPVTMTIEVLENALIEATAHGEDKFHELVSFFSENILKNLPGYQVASFEHFNNIRWEIFTNKIDNRAMPQLRHSRPEELFTMQGAVWVENDKAARELITDVLECKERRISILYKRSIDIERIAATMFKNPEFIVNEYLSDPAEWWNGDNKYHLLFLRRQYKIEAPIATTRIDGCIPWFAVPWVDHEGHFNWQTWEIHAVQRKAIRDATIETLAEMKVNITCSRKSCQIGRGRVCLVPGCYCFKLCAGHSHRLWKEHLAKGSIRDHHCTYPSCHERSHCYCLSCNCEGLCTSHFNMVASTDAISDKPFQVCTYCNQMCCSEDGICLDCKVLTKHCKCRWCSCDNRAPPGSYTCKECTVAMACTTVRLNVLHQPYPAPMQFVRYNHGKSRGPRPCPCHICEGMTYPIGLLPIGDLLLH